MFKPQNTVILICLHTNITCLLTGLYNLILMVKYSLAASKNICLTAFLTIDNLKLKSLVIMRFLNVYYLSSYKASNSKFMNTFPYYNKIQYFNSIIWPTSKSSES